MVKFAIRLLTLAIFATPLMALATHADAATNQKKHVRKHARVAQPAQASRDPGRNPFASKYEDDEDRRRANSGGGGY
jgi:hypothetical protein